MTVEIRRGSTRFVERERGRLTRHAFSFGPDYDPARLGFGPMVCYDDHVLGPGRGFDIHRHSGLEIVTYVVSGALRHTDSSGSTTVVPAGSVAVLSTGDGVEHSEIATDEGPCRFLQVWLRSERVGEPTYTLHDGTSAVEPLPGAVLRLAVVDSGVPLTLPTAPLLHAYVVSGSLLRSSLAEPLSTGDAFEMTDEGPHELTAGVPTELLVWTFHDVPAPVLMGSSGGAWMAFASPSASDHEEPDEPPIGQLQLMGEHGGAFLWDEEGGIDESFDYLHRHLGLSRDLHADLVRWGADWDSGQGGAAEHDARGRELLQRLRAECPSHDFELRL